MTATDIAALHRAVLLAPDDDAPRLVYADALRERGDEPRADFIECQIELAGGPNWKDCQDCNGFAKVGPCGLTDYYRDCYVCPSRNRALRDRERELWNRPLVLAELPDVSVCEFPPLFLAPSGGQSECIVSRGFISHVTCPLATLTGGPCGSCLGTGAIERLDSGYMRRFGLREWNGCTTCGGDGYDKRGSGRTPGIAAKLFASQPVTSVRVSDRGPQVTAGASVRWFGAINNHDHTARLPMDIFDLLSDAQSSFDYRPQFEPNKFYPSTDAAHAALSAAIVTLGRQLAGLE